MSWSTYIKLPDELQHPIKGLINIKTNDNKCFLRCRLTHLNLDGVKLCRITKKDIEIAEELNYSEVNFPVSKKDYGKTEVMYKINVNVFSHENKVVYPAYLSNQYFSDCLDLWLTSNGFTNHYVYIKDFNRLMFSKTKNKNKKYFCKSCLQCSSSENVLNEHKKDCLMINGGQNVKLEKGFIEFKNYSRPIPVPFKIYADFECLLKSCDKGVDNDCFSYTKNINTIFLAVLLINRFSLIINPVKMLCCTEEKMQF